MGEGRAYGSLSFQDTGCRVSEVYIYYVSDMINVWDTVSPFNHLPDMFPSTKIIFEPQIG